LPGSRRPRRGFHSISFWIDLENGSEFINGHLLGYCRENKITFTPWNRKDGDIPRGEPAVDRTGRTTTALFKQKNYSVVRRAVGYRRHDTAEELEVLNELYDTLWLYTNFFETGLPVADR